MRKFFLTGGAGFIGSAFVRLLIAELPDCEITNFDALTYAGNLDNVSGLDHERHRFIKGDIADPNAILQALTEGTEAVINFAAESHVDRSIASAHEFLRTNIIGTQVLLDAARAREVLDRGARSDGAGVPTGTLKADRASFSKAAGDDRT